MGSLSDSLGLGRIRLINNIISTNWGDRNIDEKKFNYNEMLFVVQEMMKNDGRDYFAERTGLRGYHIFREFVKMLLFRNIANYDSMVLLTSDKGTGKSSAAIMMGREWMRLLGLRFSPQRHIAYSNSDVMNKIETLNHFEVLILDESVRFASASDWSRRENKELKKKLAQIRTKHLLFILCFPLKIYKLDKTYTESYVNYWCDLFSRGQGALYVKDRNPVMDSWRFKEFGQVGSYTEFTDLSKVEKALKKHPNFWEIIKFPKPPGWLYRSYLSVREANVYDDDNVLKNVTKEDINNALLVLTLRDIMVDSATHTMNRISLHIKNNYDINIGKTSIQSTIDDARQLVQKLREKALHYDNVKTTVEVIEAEQKKAGDSAD